jgi:hypothetical protein
LGGARRWAALAVVLSGIFVTVMDSSIVNIAIPTIRSTLHASFGEAELTVASYALAFSTGMITGGRLGDIYGQRRVFITAFAAFTLTSFVCGVAPNIEVLIAGRLLQGASAAMLSPQVFALVRISFAEGGETPASFASRLARRNFVGGRDFAKDFGLSFQKVVDGDTNEIRRLAELSGVKVQHLLTNAIRKIGTAFEFRGQTISKLGLRRARVHVCPTCIQDDIV